MSDTAGRRQVPISAEEAVAHLGRTLDLAIDSTRALLGAVESLNRRVQELEGSYALEA